MNRVYNVGHKAEGVYYAVGGENRSKAILNYIGETSGETWEWHYTSKNDYRDRIWLSKTVEDANQKINILKDNLHNINDVNIQNYEFEIKEIV